MFENRYLFEYLLFDNQKLLDIQFEGHYSFEVKLNYSQIPKVDWMLSLYKQVK